MNKIKEIKVKNHSQKITAYYWVSERHSFVVDKTGKCLSSSCQCPQYSTLAKKNTTISVYLQIELIEKHAWRACSLTCRNDKTATNSFLLAAIQSTKLTQETKNWEFKLAMPKEVYFVWKSGSFFSWIINKFDNYAAETVCRYSFKNVLRSKFHLNLFWIGHCMPRLLAFFFILCVNIEQIWKKCRKHIHCIGFVHSAAPFEKHALHSTVKRPVI